MLDFSGQTIRGYEFRKKIGEGGYGAIYQAYQPSVEREVAIKVILPQYADNPEFAQRFESEAKIVAQLEHPHIVPLHDFWQDEKGAFLVMRWLRGGSLRDALKDNPAWLLSKTAHLLNQLADALAIAHEANVIHRDLKPENVLLDERGNAYLTDFGIAKDLTSDSHLTAPDAIVGTAAYFAPEQIQSEPVSPQTDIYSLGMMIYEIIAGEHPFGDISPVTLVMKHLQEPLPSLTDKRPDIPQAVHDVLEKATAKDANDRYPSAPALANAFQEAIRQDKTPAPAPKPTTIAISEPSQKLTHDQRNRQRMLEKVYDFWVEGVLNNSLHGEALLELGMSVKADAVEQPWAMVLQQPDQANHDLPMGIRILDVFYEMRRELLILGDPGSGKTTTLLELTRDLVLNAQIDESEPMPVVFNLSSWADERQPLEDWMVDELNSKYQIPTNIAQQWVDEDQILPLLDGLDEVKQQHRNACVTAINTFREAKSLLPMVVCSRIVDYEALTQRLKLQSAIVLQPLTRDQIDSYLAEAGDELQAVRAVLDEDEKLQRLVTSPLMLSIVTLAYRGMDLDDIPAFDTLEGRRKHLFDTYVDRMLARRGADAPYTPEETKAHLHWLASQLSTHAQSVYYIENMQGDWLQTRRQRWLYSIGIRLATAIPGALTFGVFYVLSALFLSLVVPIAFEEISRYDLLPFSFDVIIYGGLIGSAVGILIGTVVYFFRRKVQVVEALSWSGRRAIIGSVILGVVLGIFSATAINIFVSILAGSINWAGAIRDIDISIIQANRVQYANMLYGLIANQMIDFFPRLLFMGGVTGGIIGAILGGLTGKQIEMRTQPNQGIRRSFRNSWRIGLIFIFLILLVYILPVLLLFEPAVLQNMRINRESGAFFWLLMFGLTIPLIGLLIVLSRGGYAVVQHFVLRLILWRTKQAPRNLAKFLDYTSERVLTRKVGGGYIFIHRMLLDHFAQGDKAKRQAEVVDDSYEPLTHRLEAGISDETTIDELTEAKSRQQAQ